MWAASKITCLWKDLQLIGWEQCGPLYISCASLPSGMAYAVHDMQHSQTDTSTETAICTKDNFICTTPECNWEQRQTQAQVTGAHSDQVAENVWLYRSKGKRNSTDMEGSPFPGFSYVVLYPQIPEMASYRRQCVCFNVFIKWYSDRYSWKLNFNQSLLVEPKKVR